MNIKKMNGWVAQTFAVMFFQGQTVLFCWGTSCMTSSCFCPACCSWPKLLVIIWHWNSLIYPCCPWSHARYVWEFPFSCPLMWTEYAVIWWRGESYKLMSWLLHRYLMYNDTLSLLAHMCQLPCITAQYLLYSKMTFFLFTHPMG